VNLYFLVEGKRSEAIVYPKWLGYLAPKLKRIYNYDAVDRNNYYLVSGGGYPSIYNHLINAIEEVNSVRKYDYLLLCLDADESTVEERIRDVNKYLEEKKIKLTGSKFKIVVQNRCIETWFLGNKKVYPRQPKGEIFRQYARFYNVSKEDPELMGLYKGFTSISLFHYEYLKEMLDERKIKYTKKMPRGVTESNYIDRLIERVTGVDHLRSLKDFLDFCSSRVTIDTDIPSAE
jgi:hypothetical protein